MRNPGVNTLAAITLTTALSAVTYTAVTAKDGIRSLNLVCNFNYGSGGTTCKVKVQTSFDGGTTWYDIAQFDFTTASAKKWCVLQVAAAKAIAAYTALSAEGVNDGLLGPRFRASITSTGTYAGGTTVDLRMHSS